MYDEYDDGAGGSPLARKIAMGVGVVAIAAAGFFAFQAVRKDAPSEASDPSAPSTAVTGGDGGGAAAGTSTPDASDRTTAASTTQRPTASTSTTVTPTTARATTTTARATTTTAAPTTTAPATTAPAPYATLPNGDPAWVVALFDVNRITITGVVPDQAAKDRLQALEAANAKPGQADTVDNQVTLNPAVPRNVGVRVVELTSERFPESSAEITPGHAAELDRVATIMRALPKITVLVIGHADQRGDEVANFAVSDARARAVTTYLASRGIAPARLSSRAVGEADLLSLNNDDAAFALNRRTEFVFYGLLLE